jgi:WD40 repeat protein
MRRVEYNVKDGVTIASPFSFPSPAARLAALLAFAGLATAGGVGCARGAPVAIDGHPSIGPYVSSQLHADIEGYRALMFSGNSRAFAAIRYNRQTRQWDTLRVWDAKTLQPLCEPLRQSQIIFCALNFDGSTAFTLHAQDVDVWDVRTSKLRSSVHVTEKDLTYMAIRTDGRQFATIIDDADNTVAVWTTGDPKPRFRLKHQQFPSWCGFDPTGARLATCDGPIHVFSVETGTEICPPIVTDRPTLSCNPSFDGSGERLLVPQIEGFTIVSAASGKKLVDVKITDTLQIIETPIARWSGDSKKIIVTTRPFDYGPVRIYDADTGKLDGAVGSHAMDGWVTRASGLGLCLETVRTTTLGPLEVWDLRLGKRVQSLPMSSTAYVSPDLSTIMAADRVHGITEAWRIEESDKGDPR